MNCRHHSSKAVFGPGGKVLIKGSWDGTATTQDEIYDPNTEKWTVVPKK